MGRNTGRGKVAYSWISPDPAKAGPTLGVVVVVVVALISNVFQQFNFLQLSKVVASQHDLKGRSIPINLFAQKSAEMRYQYISPISC